MSRATVSHVLNGQGSRFPEQTQQKVLKAAAELQYKPSPAGRALVTGRSDILVMVIPNTTFGSNLQDLVDSVSTEAARHGLSVVVRFAGRDAAETLAAILHFRPVAVVDIGVLSPADRETLEATGAAAIPRYRRPSEPEDDLNFLVGRTMAEELLRDGPRRLAFAALVDERQDPFGPPRYEGMKAAARARGLPTPERLDIPLRLAGATTALKAFAAEGSPLGVGCYNDDVAIAVLAAGRALGLQTPGDLSVVGVDATDVGQLVSPRLTTVLMQNDALMDRIAADLDELHQKDGTQQFHGPRPIVKVILGETT
ncbi:MAG: LacI family transcriptional regulator [Pseudarthrobacter sp.]|nr:LacI family transcriptional regulator [Pseudarthrobacter sp.]